MAVSGARLFADNMTFMLIVNDLRELHLAISFFRLLADVVDTEH
jgi:hypothetical protein